IARPRPQRHWGPPSPVSAAQSAGVGNVVVVVVGNVGVVGYVVVVGSVVVVVGRSPLTTTRSWSLPVSVSTQMSSAAESPVTSPTTSVGFARRPLHRLPDIT